MINEQAINHIHSGEIILTTGRSKTVQYFLMAAAAKKRQFQVLVCEGAPTSGGHDMANDLAAAGIDTTVISDAAVFAVMARVNKVILPAHAVLANGGLVASSGSHLVALAAQHNSVPVVCTTGLFKLCPVFPHAGQDTLNDLVSPSLVVEYAELNTQLLGSVEFVNPVHDILRPEHIDLFITNVGSFQPSFIYRLLAEYYHSDDWSCFD
jgi:translation initiation factor eIF-2B subunit beta